MEDNSNKETVETTLMEKTPVLQAFAMARITCMEIYQNDDQIKTEDCVSRLFGQMVHAINNNTVNEKDIQKNIQKNNSTSVEGGTYVTWVY